MALEIEVIDDFGAEDLEIKPVFQKLFKMVLPAYNFEDRIYKAVMRALDPLLGIATRDNRFDEVYSTDEYEYRNYSPGVNNNTPEFYCKPAIFTSEWIPEMGMCSQCETEWVPDTDIHKKLGIRRGPILRNYLKYGFDDFEYSIPDRYQNIESELPPEIESTDFETAELKASLKVNRWVEENRLSDEEKIKKSGWSSSEASSPVPIKGMSWENLNSDSGWGSINSRCRTLEEVRDIIYSARLKQVRDAVYGQFEDAAEGDEIPMKIMKFEDLKSAESVDYRIVYKKISPQISEDDGHPLDAVLDFYTVQNMMEKNEIEYKNRRKILLDTLIALKDKAKKDFDVFHTRAGEIRVKLMPISKYDVDDEMRSEAASVDLNLVRDYQSDGSEW